MLWLVVLLLITLYMVASVSPKRSSVSEFELQRRLDAKHKGAIIDWQRSDLQVEIMTLRRVLIALLLVVTSALLISRYGWNWGLFWAVIVTFTYNRAATFLPVKTFAQRLYDQHEQAILDFVTRMRPAIRPLRGVADEQVERTIASREELVHLIKNDTSLFTKAERDDLVASIDFREKIVRDYMTPRSVMEAVGANELLGPLTLDNLHKTGHTHFPVMEGDIDHLVGMLHIYSLFTLENKKSLVVRDVMEPRVFYVHEQQTLEDALSACIKHRRHLLVVVNEYRETVGVITVEDAVEQLIGRKIVDQFAAHDDLRAVAARNPRGNNLPKQRVDI